MVGGVAREAKRMKERASERVLSTLSGVHF